MVFNSEETKIKTKTKDINLQFDGGSTSLLFLLEGNKQGIPEFSSQLSKQVEGNHQKSTNLYSKVNRFARFVAG